MPYMFIANEFQKEFLNVPTLAEIDKCLTSLDISLDFDEPEPNQESDLRPIKCLFEPLLKGEIGTIYIGNDEFTLNLL